MSEEQSGIYIHIDWYGPHSLKEIGLLVGPEDFGVYQVYGTHPVYGSGVLLYIGRASKQTFATRLGQEWWAYNPDAGRIEVYVGRLWGRETPDNDTWERHIELAERLLIRVHEPSQNSQKGIRSLEADLRRVHVINWNRYRDLLPEVSGPCWTDRFFDEQTFRRFSTEHHAAKAEVGPTIKQA